MKQTLMSALQDFVNVCPPGASRDQLQRGIDTVSQRARDLPARMAAQGPFADAAEERAIWEGEWGRVLDGWQEGCEQISASKS
jgi:type II secretory pathway component PulK